MKINIKILSVFFIITLAALSGCKRGDDYFISPNEPETITPALFLTSIEVSTFNTYESDLVKRSSIYMQQNAGVEGQSLQANNYVISEQDFSSTWSQPYQTLLSCKQLNDQFGEKNSYYSGIADILSVMNWGILTDMWGDIPFSDALKGSGNNYQSKYDKQEDVYKGMMSLLDGAIVKLSKDSTENEQFPKGDFVFGGKPDLWIKVAYSLKARYLNRLSKKTTYNPAAILDAIHKGISSTGEDFISVHTNEAGGTNQWFDFQNNRYRYMLAALPFVDSLQLRPTDERINYYFDKESSAGTIIGSPVNAPNPNASTWGSYLAGSGDIGIHLISFTEMKFVEAEVKARQNDGSASDALNEAIKESCRLITKGTYDGSDIANYTAVNTNVNRVIYEKWLALFGSAEPYNDYRRTGFPVLIPNSAGVLNVIPKRNPTSSIERTGNPNAPVVSLTDPVWFAQ